jgi:hypothetical protein
MPFSQRGVKDYFQEIGFYCENLYLRGVAKSAQKEPLRQICQAMAISAHSRLPQIRWRGLGLQCSERVNKAHGLLLL